MSETWPCFCTTVTPDLRKSDVMSPIPPLKKQGKIPTTETIKPQVPGRTGILGAGPLISQVRGHVCHLSRLNKRLSFARACRLVQLFPFCSWALSVSGSLNPKPETRNSRLHWAR